MRTDSEYKELTMPDYLLSILIRQRNSGYILWRGRYDKIWNLVKNRRSFYSMGLFRKFINQTRKPEGILGKMMVNGMNSGHAKMADWGMSHLKTSHS